MKNQEIFPICYIKIMEKYSCFEKNQGLKICTKTFYSNQIMFYVVLLNKLLLEKYVLLFWKIKQPLSSVFFSPDTYTQINIYIDSLGMYKYNKRYLLLFFFVAISNNKVNLSILHLTALMFSINCFHLILV